MQECKSLQMLDKARAMLAECRTIQDVKKAMSLADAAQVWARKLKLGEESLHHCQAIRNEAELMLGEMLLANKDKMAKGAAQLGVGRRGKQCGSTLVPHYEPATLSDMGLDKKESARAQKLVKVTNAKPEVKTALLAGTITANDAVKPMAHVGQNSGENEWYTPAPFIAAARSTMGGIDCDPASSEKANEAVKAKQFWTAKDDGLSRKWGKRVWMNPPYAQPLCAQFMALLLTKVDSREVEQACILVNNATETTWLQPALKRCTAVCFPSGRVRFIDVNGNPGGAPLQGQCVLYFGSKPQNFRKSFEGIGVVFYGN